MHVSKIRTEGPHLTPLRAVHRVNLEILTASANGTTVCEHRIQPDRVNRIEVYLDRLGEVLEKVRKPEHEAARERAESYAADHIAEWRNQRAAEIRNKKKRGATDEEIEAWQERSCPIHWTQFLALAGLKTGIPPLTLCEVISRDGTKRVPLVDFVAEDFGDREPFLTEPFDTPETQNDRMSTYLATIAAAVSSKGGRK